MIYTFMEDLYYFNDIVSAKITLNFKRSLFDSIDWNQKMIAIKGARGVGKTTLSYSNKSSDCVKMTAPFM